MSQEKNQKTDYIQHSAINLDGIVKRRIQERTHTKGINEVKATDLLIGLVDAYLSKRFLILPNEPSVNYSYHALNFLTERGTYISFSYQTGTPEQARRRSEGKVEIFSTADHKEGYSIYKTLVQELPDLIV